MKYFTAPEDLYWRPIEQVIYRFLSAGTMDEKIYQRQLAKSDLGDLIMVSATQASP